MGYEANDAVLVSSWLWDGTDRSKTNSPVVTIGDVTRFREAMPEEYRHLLVGPVHFAVNGGATFILCPDGSKEGWNISDDLDIWRRRFLDLFSARNSDGSSYYEIVHVRWGGDHAGYFGATLEYANDEHHDPQVKAEKEAAL